MTGRCFSRTAARVAALSAVVGTVSTTAAQERAAPVAADHAGSCEIHVWPAGQLNTLTEGAVWNNTLNSAISPTGGKTRERTVPAGRLAPDGQRALLHEVDLGGMFHQPGATVIWHDGPSARHATGAKIARQTASESPCYVELTIAKNFFNRSALAERTLKTLLIFDDFGDQPTPRRSFMGWGSTELQIFPAKQPDLAGAADEELSKAFRNNIVKFAGYAFATPKKR